MSVSLETFLERCRREGRSTLTEVESKSLLATYDVPVVEERLTHSLEETHRAATAIGYPVVLKGVDPEITHTTESGMIHLDINSPAELEHAFESIVDVLGDPTASAGGILVQQFTPGEEIILGMRNDDQFGPIIMVGLGGIFVELFDDVAFGIPPIDPPKAQSMIESTRAAQLLQGYRGRPTLAVETLASTISAFTSFCTDGDDDLVEVDINPLIVTEDSVVAVDALIRLDIG